MADRSSRLPAAVADVPPRPAGQRQLQPRRHAARTRPSNIALSSLGAGRYHLTFTAPGDNGACGTPASYLVRVNGKSTNLPLGAPVAGGSAFSAEVTLPAGARNLSIQAIDAAGNLGPKALVKVR